MADIVTRLGCAYPRHGTTDCGLCTFCLAKAEIERLRALLDAIDARHAPDDLSQWCREDANDWPCPTHQMLHPEVQP